MKQLSLTETTYSKFYGGSLIDGKRKSLRPLCSKRPTHLILKCGKGVNLFNHRNPITTMINKYAERFGHKVLRLSVQFDHIHIILVIHDRPQYTKFIRSLTGMLARKFGAGLFKALPFTRVGSWGRDYRGMKNYLTKNDLEVWGLKTYEPRKDYYGRHRKS